MLEGALGSLVRNLHNLEYLKKSRRELRNSMTPAEALLWRNLRRSQLGKKFRRQHSIGPYIVDFFCPECRVAVELDGAGPMTEFGAERDTQRTKFLERFNIRIIRIENRWVFENLEGVLEVIRETLRS